jgi:alkylation response protein AidB-like acyl-CoA dehydrogenase
VTVTIENTASSLGNFRDRTREFVSAVLLPAVTEWERAENLPREAFQAMAEAGLTGHVLPAEVGGLGLDMAHSAVLMEELMAHGLLGVATSLLAQSHTVLPLVAELGTPEQQTRFLHPAVRGELVSGIAITEPAGGSDLMGAVQTTATRGADGWVLNGRKMFITNGPVADFLIVLARTEPDRGALGMSLFLVETSNPGFRVVEKLDKMGIRCSPTGLLEFTDCQVDATAVLGKLNHGFPNVTRKLVNERILSAVGALASARACIRQTVRVLGDEPVPSDLSRLMAEVEAGFAFTDLAIARIVAGETLRQDVAAAKFTMPGLLQRVVKRCMELTGVAAFHDDTLISRVFRDARVISVFAGSSETMREMYVAGLIPGRGQ